MNCTLKRFAVSALCVMLAVSAVGCSDNKKKQQSNDIKDIQQAQQGQNSSEQNDESDVKPQETPEDTAPKAELPTHLDFGEGKDNVEISGKAYEAPSEQDVIDAYKKASEAILWFNGYSVPALDKNATYYDDGVHYAKVKSDSVKDFESMRVYLEEIFDFDMADLLIDDNNNSYNPDEKNRFIERDDGLYCIAFNKFRGVADEVYSVSKESEDEYVITVDYKQVDANGSVIQTKTAKYSFVNVDGKWVFDINFTLHCI